MQSEEKLVELQMLINARVWTEVVLPKLDANRRTAFAKLMDPSRNRKDVQSDDFLRGVIVTLDSVMALPQVMAGRLSSEIAQSDSGA